MTNPIQSSHSYEGYNVHVFIPCLSAWWYLILQRPLLYKGPQILQTIFLSDTLQRSQVSPLRIHASALYRMMSLINVLQVFISTYLGMIWLLSKDKSAKYALFVLFILSSTVLMSLLSFNNVPRYGNSQQCWRCIVRFRSLQFPLGAHRYSLFSKTIAVPIGVTDSSPVRRQLAMLLTRCLKALIVPLYTSASLWQLTYPYINIMISRKFFGRLYRKRWMDGACGTLQVRGEKMKDGDNLEDLSFRSYCMEQCHSWANGFSAS
jgi:hypothetical protein